MVSNRVKTLLLTILFLDQELIICLKVAYFLEIKSKIKKKIAQIPYK